MSYELVSAIGTAEQREFDRDFADYITLLRKGEPTPTNVKRLRDLLSRLGLNADDARADLQRINRFLELEKLVESGQGCDRLYQQKREELKAHEERVRQARLKMEEDRRKLYFEGQEFSSKFGGAEAALIEMKELKTKWPQLFTDKEIPDLKP